MTIISFKLALRRLVRNARFSLINILGLATGIAASCLIYAFIYNETSYDSYHSKKNQIYRVVVNTSNRSNGEVTGRSGSVPLPLPYAMRADFPQFEKVAAIVNAGSPQVYISGEGQSEEKRFLENTGVFYAEPALFDILDFKWLSGNARRLEEPNAVVLSESLAVKYFGDWRKAEGKTIQLWSWRSKYLVTGVYRDLPANTDVPAEMVMAYTSLHPVNNNYVNRANLWRYTDNVFKTECFLLLSKGQDIAAAERALPSFVEKYYKETQDHTATTTSLMFQPLKAMHLDERYNTYKEDALPVKELWALGIIGLFVLLIACINFINLSTAQSVSQSREVGVRKILGGNRRSLIRQFLFETALVTLAAIILGYFIAELALPSLIKLTGKLLSLDLVDNSSLPLFLLVTWVATTLLSGVYPGFILSRFDPLTAINNQVRLKTGPGISVRRSLVVTQFVIAQFLVIGTLVVVGQMDFFRDRPMGFEKKAIAIIDLPSDSADQQKYNYLKQQMLQVPGVIDASFCMDPPSSDEKIFDHVYYDRNPQKLEPDPEVQFADTSYLNTFGIQLIAGRLPLPADTIREILVNETAARKMGVQAPDQILGKSLSYNSRNQYPIVGVFRDFNSRSLREPVLPLVLSTNKSQYTDLAIRIKPEKLVSAMPQVEKVFKRIIPSYLYNPVFFDESIWRYYQKEAVTAQIFRIFAIIAIVLSCLGLYGLVSFMAVQKTKEVGIRKVLGASVQSILYLFSREFIFLIAIAFLIAGPLGYYVMHQWLSGFYNHMDIGWTIFVLAILISLLIGGLTILYTTMRAALSNPVNSLRAE
ncbi:MAG TPA: ABC transporter permease [Puia sp.]|nr:ABC transporter permease [Puia sp.]